MSISRDAWRLWRKRGARQAMKSKHRAQAASSVSRLAARRRGIISTAAACMSQCPFSKHREKNVSAQQRQHISIKHHGAQRRGIVWRRRENNIKHSGVNVALHQNWRSGESSGNGAYLSMSASIKRAHRSGATWHRGASRQRQQRRQRRKASALVALSYQHLSK